MAYLKLEKERVVYCDVDDTLILWDTKIYPHEEKDLITFSDEYGIWQLLPHQANINFLINLKRQGYGIVVWSAAGASWAETVINKLGLQKIPDMILSKPELAMDDLLEPDRIIKSVVWIHPVTGDFKRNA